MLAFLLAGRKYQAALVTAIVLMIVHFAVVARDLKPFHSDFRVYYRAGQDFLSANNLYDLSIFYRYKYSPSAAIFFAPFALLPYELASAFFSLLLSCAIAFCIHWFTKSVQPLGSLSFNRIFFLTALVCGVHLHAEFMLGQVNVFILLSYILMYHFMRTGQPFLAGIPLALSVFVKPFGLIFIPYYLLDRRYKFVASVAGFSLLWAFLPTLRYGYNHAVALWRSWFVELGIELQQKADLLASGNHTVFSVLARLCYDLQIVGFSEGSHKKIFVAFTLMLMLGCFFCLRSLLRNSPLKEYIEFGVIVTSIPLLSYTAFNLFFYAIPLITFLLNVYKENSRLWRVMCVLGFLCIGINMFDLVGKRNFEYLNSISLVSWGQILVLCCSFWAVYALKLRSEQSLARLRSAGEIK